MYAVAYGCALRTETDTNLEKIATFVYNKVFEKGNPPAHILLRDYARNIIEYAFYKKLVSQIDMKLVRPPYRSKFPDSLPSTEDIKQYNADNKDSDDKSEKEKNRIFSQIHFSTIYWDFGKYTIENALRNFTPISFTRESEFKIFKQSLTRDQRRFVNAIASNIEMQALLNEKKEDGIKKIGDQHIENFIAETLQFYQQFSDALAESLKPEDWMQFQNKYVPYLHGKYTNNQFPRGSIKFEPIKNWIVKRSFELGYDIESHYEFDSLVDRFNSYGHEKKIERIGKKYQWIALHEIIALLADNYYFKEDEWSSKEKRGFFQGPWQQHLRDIDPIFITHKNQEDTDDNFAVIRNRQQKKWWFDTDYSYWDQATDQWINNLLDLPDPGNIILRKDEHNEEWLYLKVNANWEEPKEVGQERYDRVRKEIYYLINAYLVRKKDFKKNIEGISNKNFFGRWMPETYTVSTSLFNRENYWSPVAIKNNKNSKKWETIHDTKLQVMITTNEAVGEMTEDDSGAHFRFDMPSKALFEGMELSYAPVDGSFKNSKGEVVVFNISSHGVIIRKKELMAFLEKNNYEIIWTLLGEKNAIAGSSLRDNNQLRAISGVFYLEGSKVIGTLSISNRH